MVLLALAAYLGLALLAVSLAARWAGRHGQRGWLWGGLAAFAMYNLVFWDWIPTVAVHKHYCATEAGFWVYKTPEQWAKENPGVLETLHPPRGAPSTRVGNMASFTDTYATNDRFNWVVSRAGPEFPNQWRHEQTFVDARTNEVLARYKDFSTSQIAPQAGWNGWKLWLAKDHCEAGDRNYGRMLNFMNSLRGENS